MFDRYGAPHDGRTWAFYSFKENHHELNFIYWSYRTMSEYTNFNVRKQIKNGNEDAYGFFDLYGQPEQRRLGANLKEWQKSAKNLEKWIRNNSLLVLVGNLETYIGRAVATSLESNPALVFGGEIAPIDGMKYAINGAYENEEFKNLVESTVRRVTRGTWVSRVSELKKVIPALKTSGIFDQMEPSFGKDRLSILQEMQNSRNDIAHSFGRGIVSTINNRQIKGNQRKSISEDVLLKYLSVVYDLVRELDGVFVEIIGSYEEALFYHRMYAQLKDKYPRMSEGDIRTRIRKYFSQEYRSNGKQYIAELGDYYKTLRE